MDLLRCKDYRLETISSVFFRFLLFVKKSCCYLSLSNEKRRRNFHIRVLPIKHKRSSAWQPRVTLLKSRDYKNFDTSPLILAWRGYKQTNMSAFSWLVEIFATIVGIQTLEHRRKMMRTPSKTQRTFFCILGIGSTFFSATLFLTLLSMFRPPFTANPSTETNESKRWAGKIAGSSLGEY